jgi:hypothetical protein
MRQFGRKKYSRAGQATDNNIIRSLPVACWMTKATDRHLEYVILIAFPLQQLLHEHTSMLPYT